ncbi:hypothetical protein J6590_034625 [Homalodisca vitripennis]|nr:hypothetical protein J6590_034625 [Homalodisca vitripennis]
MTNQVIDKFSLLSTYTDRPTPAGPSCRCSHASVGMCSDDVSEYIIGCMLNANHAPLNMRTVREPVSRHNAVDLSGRLLACVQPVLHFHIIYLCAAPVDAADDNGEAGRT